MLNDAVAIVLFSTPGLEIMGKSWDMDCIYVTYIYIYNIYIYTYTYYITYNIIFIYIYILIYVLRIWNVLFYASFPLPVILISQVDAPYAGAGAKAPVPRTSWNMDQLVGIFKWLLPRKNMVIFYVNKNDI